MAKKIKAIVKLQIPAGKANPAPPIGPALAQHGINLMQFCKEYNARTSNRMGDIIPAEITIYQDASFKFALKSPPTAFLIKKTLGIAKGASNPKTENPGTLSRKQIQEIAETKMEDLNAHDLDSAMKQIAGTAQQMGVKVNWDS
ncbi:MAG: 50S ribosomal protein L11 [Aggregatilineales bacterium]